MAESEIDDWYPLCEVDALADGALERFMVNEIALVGVRIGNE